jgi:hypothetical protein
MPSGCGSRSAVQCAAARAFFWLIVVSSPQNPHVLTDNGLHFADPLCESWTAAEIKELIARTHAFEYTCAKADIDHRLTKPKRVC